MPIYRIAGQEIYFSCPVPDLESYEIAGAEQEVAALPVDGIPTLISRMTGWVGGEMRRVETWAVSRGSLLKVEGGCDCYISSGGDAIVRANETREVTAFDREILLGPALVLALALRGVWCLHASAAVFDRHTFVFLGESGQGKSTLAAYLVASGGRRWRLVADDILPVTIGPTGMVAWPHFPQRKLSMQAQPATRLPERLPVDRICVLSPVDKSALPDLLLLPSRQAAQTLVSHTAGARLFDPSLLAAHLAFCAEVARQILVYKLAYPHNRDTLSKVKLMLEITC